MAGLTRNSENPKQQIGDQSRERSERRPRRGHHAKEAGGNDDTRMTKDEGMPKPDHRIESAASLPVLSDSDFGNSGFFRHSPFVIRISVTALPPFAAAKIRSNDVTQGFQ